MEPRERPHDHKRPADDLVDRDGPAPRQSRVRARIRRVVAMVALDPEPAGRYDDVERQRPVVAARVQVVLLERRAVHGDLALAVTADDMVARNADDPLDEVLLAGRRKAEVAADLAELAQYRVVRLRDAAFRRPRVDAAEHDDLAALDVPHLVGQPVDNDPVALLQGVLHRPRWNEEGLKQEAVDADGDGGRDDQQDDRLDPERPVWLPSLSRL